MGHWHCIRSFVPCFWGAMRKKRTKQGNASWPLNATNPRHSVHHPPNHHTSTHILRRSAFAGTVLVAFMSGLAPSLSLPPLIIIIASSLMNSRAQRLGLRRQAIKAAMVIPIMDNLTSSPGIRDSRGYPVLTAARSMFIACAHGLYQQYLSPMSTGIGLRRSSSRSDIRRGCSGRRARRVA